jgi:hypothetical protein
MIRPFARSICIVLVVTSFCIAQTSNRTRLFPQNTKPQKDTRTLISAEKRIGGRLYQIFYFRNEPKHEVFRVNIGFYDKGQLVSDWSYGVVLEKDMNNDGIPDYVWYGGDDTGQRLLWFLSKDNHYECIDIFKSAELAWTKRFKSAAPDLGEVFGDNMADDVVWDGLTRHLTVSVEADAQDLTKAHKVNLTFDPTEFVSCGR